MGAPYNVTRINPHVLFINVSLLEKVRMVHKANASLNLCNIYVYDPNNIRDEISWMNALYISNRIYNTYIVINPIQSSV
jgi:hypothetical protein